jgi:hypothetical protein
VYGFAGGDPVNFDDPFGLWPIPSPGFGARVAVEFARAVRAARQERFEQDARAVLQSVNDQLVGDGIARAASALIPTSIFRSGKSNPSNLTPRPGVEDGVSVRTSLSNPIESRAAPVFRPGGHVTEIDVGRLPSGSVLVDNTPPGHAEIRGATAEQVKAAVIKTTKLP